MTDALEGRVIYHLGHTYWDYPYTCKEEYAAKLFDVPVDMLGGPSRRKPVPPKFDWMWRDVTDAEKVERVRRATSPQYENWYSKLTFPSEEIFGFPVTTDPTMPRDHFIFKGTGDGLT